MISIIIDKITRQYGRGVGTMAWAASAWGVQGELVYVPFRSCRTCVYNRMFEVI